MKNGKERSEKIAFVLLIIVLIFTACFYSVSTYYSFAKNESIAKFITYNYYSTELYGLTFESNYVLDFNGRQKKDPNLNLCAQYTNLDCTKVENQQMVKRLFDEWSYNLRFRYINLEYQMLDENGNTVATNTKTDLSKIFNEETSTFNQDYQWYFSVTYDHNGNRTYIQSNGYPTESENQYLNEHREFFYGLRQEVVSETAQEELSTTEISSIKNQTFIYAIPISLVTNGGNDIISRYVEEHQHLNWDNMVYVNGIFLLIGLLGPIGLLLKFKSLKKILTIPLEIFLALFPAFLVFLGFMSEKFVHVICNQDIFLLIQSVPAVFGLNIAWWALQFFLSLLIAWWVRYVFHLGPIHYLKEHSLIVRFVNWFVIKIKFYFISDLTDSKVIKLLILLGINALLLILFFGANPFLTILYSLCLLLISKYTLKKIKTNYLDLLKVTHQMAQGNLEVDINKDLGIFNSIKDELKQIKNGFSNAILEETKSQKMKTELISNVSHDLKTPLTSIISYIDLLKNEELTLEQKTEYIQILDRNSLRLKHLIEDLFEVSKANSGDISLNVEEVDIIELLTQTEFELQDQIEKSGLSFKKAFVAEKIMLYLDSQKTYRIFENLYVNAIKYSLLNSRVYITAAIVDNAVEISFRNTAASEIDFDPNDIVERFARGDRSRNSEGSGLGLAISKSFTELQNGTFDIYTDEDIFKVKLRFPIE